LSLTKKWKWLVDDINDPYKKSLAAKLAETQIKMQRMGRWPDIAIYSEVLWRKDFEFN
jgi:hypothetical protein